MSEGKHYVLEVRDKARSIRDPLMTHVCVSSPISLDSRQLSVILFEKVVQKDVTLRTRDFKKYREEHLSIRGVKYKGIFRRLDDVVVAYRKDEFHKQPQWYARVDEVAAAPCISSLEGATVAYRHVQCTIGTVETILAMAPYLTVFDGMRASEQGALLSDMFLRGGPHLYEERAKERIDNLIRTDKDATMQLGLPFDEQRERNELSVLIEKQVRFMRALAKTFSLREIEQMHSAAARQSPSAVLPLAVLVQHTDTIYMLEEPRSYAKD